MAEKSIIERAKEGDVKAFEELISEHLKVIYNVAYRVVGNYDDASDVAQEALIKIFKNLIYFEERSKFTTWIFRIVTNTALDYVKKNRKGNVVSMDEMISGEENEYEKQFPSTDDSPHQMLEREERKKVVLEALNKLSVEHRAVLVLRDMQGLSYEEIAIAMLLTEGTVKSRINRARKVLRDILMKNKELFEDFIV